MKKKDKGIIESETILKEMFNWKKIGITLIKIIVILILNSPLWVYLIGSMVPYATIGEFKLSWIDYLRLSDKVAFYHIWLLYLFIAVGIILTYSFIKLWIAGNKKEKEKQEQRAHQEQQTQQIINAIKTTKQQEKEKNDVEKYL